MTDHRPPAQPTPPRPRRSNAHTQPQQDSSARPQPDESGTSPREAHESRGARRPFTEHLTETITEFSGSVLQARDKRKQASMPPPTAPTDVVPPAEPPENSDVQKVSLVTNPVKLGFLGTVGVGLALLAYYAFTNVGALAGWVTGAVFIALGLDPAVRRLEKWGIRRGVGVLLVVTVFAGTVTGLTLWIVPIISEQANSFIYRSPAIFQDFLESEAFKNFDDMVHIRDWVDKNVPAFIESITSSNAISGFMGNLVTAGSTIAQVLTGTVIVLFLSLYFLSSMNTIKAWGVRLAPASQRERVSYLVERITGSVGSYVMGQALVAILNATFALITMSILGFSFPQLLALFVLILAFIPLVGGVVALVVVSLILLISGWQMALTFAIVYFIYLQVEAYVISPRIMSRAVSVPGGVAIIAVAAGGALWGVLGALIAIPVAASLLILVKEVFIPYQDTK